MNGTAAGPAGGPGDGRPARPGGTQDGVPTDGPVPASAVMPDPATPEPPRPGAAAPGALDAVAVRRVWPEVVGKVNRSNKRIAALMRDAVVRDLDGDTLVLTVKSAVLARMMSDHAQVLTDALYEELGGRWQIRCEVAGERGGASPGPHRSPSAPGPAPVDASRRRADQGRSGGAAGARRSDTPAATTAEDSDDDWPETARPGGSAPSAADDWPEAARPGGARDARRWAGRGADVRRIGWSGYEPPGRVGLGRTVGRAAMGPVPHRARRERQRQWQGGSGGRGRAGDAYRQGGPADRGRRTTRISTARCAVARDVPALLNRPPLPPTRASIRVTSHSTRSSTRRPPASRARNRPYACSATPSAPSKKSATNPPHPTPPLSVDLAVLVSANAAEAGIRATRSARSAGRKVTGVRRAG